jgi:hypothetical protein
LAVGVEVGICFQVDPVVLVVGVVDMEVTMATQLYPEVNHLNLRVLLQDIHSMVLLAEHLPQETLEVQEEAAVQVDLVVMTLPV